MARIFDAWSFLFGTVNTYAIGPNLSDNNYYQSAICCVNSDVRIQVSEKGK
jgi:hypothetical protein